MRVGIASGESPSEGPRVVTSRWPLDRSNAGASAEYAWKNPADIITWTSAASAAPAISRAATPVRVASQRVISLGFIVLLSLGLLVREQAPTCALHSSVRIPYSTR